MSIYDPYDHGDRLVIEPLTVRIATAVHLTGISRSRLYELIQSGDLTAVKVGKITLIPFDSLKALLHLD